MTFSSTRRLLTLAGVSLLTGGCARYARHLDAVKNIEAQYRSDLELARAVKTATILAPETDRDLAMSVTNPLIPRREYVESLKRRKDEFRAALYAGMTYPTLSAEMAEVLSDKLLGLGYTTKVVFDDELTQTRQSMSEAQLGPDLVVGLFRPMMSLSIEVNTVGYDRYFVVLSARSSVFLNGKHLTVGGGGRASQEGKDPYPYLLPDQINRPEAVRGILLYQMNRLADRLLVNLAG